MTEPAHSGDLLQSVRQTIQQRAQSPARAWPQIGRDVLLLEEDGPGGCLLFSCRTDQSMSNPMGIVHGGVTASLVDTCMGVACTAQSGGLPTPTVTMTVNYARPVPLDREIRVRVRTLRIGFTSAQMSAEVFLPECPEEVLATASGIYAVRR